jgi:hypothetical protein
MTSGDLDPWALEKPAASSALSHDSLVITTLGVGQVHDFKRRWAITLHDAVAASITNYAPGLGAQRPLATWNDSGVSGHPAAPPSSVRQPSSTGIMIVLARVRAEFGLKCGGPSVDH